MKNIKISFLCDTKLPCRTSDGCFKNGGFCKHTSDINHATNFIEWRKKDESTFSEISDDNDCVKNGNHILEIVTVLLLLAIFIFLRRNS